MSTTVIEGQYIVRRGIRRRKQKRIPRKKIVSTISKTKQPIMKKASTTPTAPTAPTASTTPTAPQDLDLDLDPDLDPDLHLDRDLDLRLSFLNLDFMDFVDIVSPKNCEQNNQKEEQEEKDNEVLRVELECYPKLDLNSDWVPGLDLGVATHLTRKLAQVLGEDPQAAVPDDFIPWSPPSEPQLQSFSQTVFVN
jgi:hypothetical protein